MPPITEANELTRSLHCDALIDATRDNIKVAIMAELEVSWDANDAGGRCHIIPTSDVMLELDGEDLLGWYAAKNPDEYEGEKDWAVWRAYLMSAKRVRSVLTLRFIVN